MIDDDMWFYVIINRDLGKLYGDVPVILRMQNMLLSAKPISVFVQGLMTVGYVCSVRSISKVDPNILPPCDSQSSSLLVVYLPSDFHSKYLSDSLLTSTEIGLTVVICP